MEFKIKTFLGRLGWFCKSWKSFSGFIQTNLYATYCMLRKSHKIFMKTAVVYSVLIELQAVRSW